MDQVKKQANSSHPSLLRVIGAILYDSLALFAVFMIAGFIVVPILGHPPATQYEHLVFQGLLLTLTYLFFCWFWTHGGQTLGMRSWKIKLLDQHDMTVGWPVATRRFLLAIVSWLPLGLGYFWILFNREGLSWHDKLSKTHLVHLPGQPKKKKAD